MDPTLEVARKLTFRRLKPTCPKVRECEDVLLGAMAQLETRVNNSPDRENLINGFVAIKTAVYDFFLLNDEIRNKLRNEWVEHIAELIDNHNL
ncbi:MAG: hypothetical protein UY48_C0006G0003 [Candidatus Gottesmanbacteria bacterium GW2011_GWB1_49_7]|uniref:Uncharacterized protein n=1 Tax=Candidatus Gottesmanbacteria bacterium GW2011_GWB1_49_7 TaxID=1618448 RepID=A0A0G1W2Y3_9BACT|nr:MAG: hypothetical protein UY48_C0006G0003 [Candidatus Gottesmanbacteria bacterium GW2011_GWB1_49_7]